MKYFLQDKGFFRTFSLGTFVISSWGLILNSLFRIRPLQDDYLVLNSISNSSIGNFLSSIWESQGGNLFPYAVNAVLLSPAEHQLNFIGITLFYIITLVAVAGAGLLMLKMLLGVDLKIIGKVNLFVYVTLVFVSFEGLFVPSFAGAFSFSLASLAHLWPVILMIYFVYLLRYPTLFPVALLGGLLIGNSNAGESFTALLVGFFLLLRSLRKRERSTILYSGSLVAGILFGFIAMISAPGFSNRANNSVGLPSSASELAQRFVKAAVSFPADALTHPGAYLALIAGIILVRINSDSIDLEPVRQNALLLLAAISLLLVSLVGGGTLAYSSWHQALGVDMLVVPVFLGGGVLLGSYISQRFLDEASKVVILLLIVTSLVSTRGAYLLHERSNAWDIGITQNICTLREQSTLSLQGAELRYPPLELGIEDIQTWEWMKISYTGWVRGLKEFRTTSCA